MEINMSCYCKNKLPETKIAVIHPCEHFLHDECVSNLLKKCPYCKINIQKITLHDNVKYLKNERIKINHKSISPIYNLKLNYNNIFYASVKLCALLNEIITISSNCNLDNTLYKIMETLKIKIKINDNTKKNKVMFKDKITWIKKEDDNCKKIIISNHTNDFDGLIIYYLFRCGFIASDFINNDSIGSIVSKKCKLLTFKRGATTGMVTKIKEYLNEHKIICIFPEGAYACNDTILKFRSGAFYSNDIICPITIKYENEITDGNLQSSLLKLLSLNQDNHITVNINDFEYGPFNDSKIEEIRNNMASQLKYSLSNVSNKTIKD
jgi:hypothetical protein